MPGNTGTSAPRDHIFKEATGDAVLVIDSHVLLWPDSVRRLIEFYKRNPECRDLLSGSLVLDSLAGVHTHFADKWRDGMWGTWDTDSRGTAIHNPPFEIPAQGLGLFSCRRDVWLGFNPHFREFGGEEWYIHEKYRQAGARCLCLPFLRWQHRFADVPPGSRATANNAHHAAAECDGQPFASTASDQVNLHQTPISQRSRDNHHPATTGRRRTASGRSCKATDRFAHRCSSNCETERYVPHQRWFLDRL